MKTMFYIVRHGQTLFNVKGLIQGWSDSPLTPLGVHQAQLMAEKISPIEFILGVSSTSERARDTLLTITQERFPVLFYKDLKEISFGTLEGGDRQPLLESPRRDYTPWGGENFDEAGLRVERRLITIAKHVGNRNVLVVSHGTVLREVIHDLDPNYNDIMPNCSMMKIACEDGQLSLVSYPEVLI